MEVPGHTIYVQDSVAGPKVTEHAGKDPAHIRPDEC